MNGRNLSSIEMYAMGFCDMQTLADEEGWAYPDDDDEETTEQYCQHDGLIALALTYRSRCPSRPRSK